MAFPPHWCRFQQQFNISLITQAEFQALLKKIKHLLVEVDVLR